MVTRQFFLVTRQFFFGHQTIFFWSPDNFFWSPDNFFLVTRQLGFKFFNIDDQAVPVPAGAELPPRDRAWCRGLSWGPQNLIPTNKWKRMKAADIWRSTRVRPWSAWQTRSRANSGRESFSRTNRDSTRRGNSDFDLRQSSGGRIIVTDNLSGWFRRTTMAPSSATLYLSDRLRWSPSSPN